jgi:hypothetical protein
MSGSKGRIEETSQVQKERERKKTSYKLLQKIGIEPEGISSMSLMSDPR